jgi:hypothetical protein
MLKGLPGATVWGAVMPYILAEAVEKREIVVRRAAVVVEVNCIVAVVLA